MRNGAERYVKIIITCDRQGEAEDRSGYRITKKRLYPPLAPGRAVEVSLEFKIELLPQFRLTKTTTFLTIAEALAWSERMSYDLRNLCFK